MDKQTLSNYGWIVICVLVLATLLAFATPFGTFIARGFETATTGFSFTTGNAVSDTIGDLNPTPLSELQERHKFDYYSSLALAVDDINAGTIGKNADRNKDNAVAGVYVYKGMPYAVLLKDNKEAKTVKPKVDMTINLGGNTLTSNVESVIICDKGNVTIDGRLENSTIKTKDGGKCIGTYKDSVVEINKGFYTLENSVSGNGYLSPIGAKGKLTINDATIVSSGVSFLSGIVARGSYADVTINNCVINVETQSGAATGIECSNVVNINSSQMMISCLSGDSTKFTSAISFKNEANEFDNKAIANINDAKITVNSKNNLTNGFFIATMIANKLMTLETEINLYNTHIYVMSENNEATGIRDIGTKNPVINITKSDIVVESHSTQNKITAYGICSVNEPTITINRSAILANKHLEKTNIQNSIGIYTKGTITNKYSNIFGTKTNID